MSAAGRGDVRNPYDFYPTPDSCVCQILNEVDFTKVKSFVEPCRGDGVIYNKIPEGIIKDFAEIREGRDYLRETYKSDLVITNPPFSIALDFLQKSLSESTSVVYLLRLNFLGSQKRKEFWNTNPPTHIFVLSKRPSFTGKGTDATEYAWFVWDSSSIIKRPPGVYVI